MANYGQPNVGFLLVGGYNLLGVATDVTPPNPEAVLEQSDTLGDNWEEHTATGTLKSAFSQRGFFDDATASINDALAGAGQTERVISISHEGNTIGKKFISAKGAFGAKYSRIVSRGALHKANVDYTVTGEVRDGVILQSLATKTGDWNTEATSVDTGLAPATISGNSVAQETVVTTSAAHGFRDGQSVVISGSDSTPVIDGAHRVTVLSATTFSIPVTVTVAGAAGTVTASGGAGFQQVTAFSGFSGFVGKVRHSDDNATFADLATFANVTSAPAAERVAVSTSTAVNRYLAYDGNVTGTGSITVFGGFVRG